MALYVLRGQVPDFDEEWGKLSPLSAFHYLGVIVDFLICTVVFGAVYAVCWALLPGGRRSIRELRQLSRDLRSRRNAEPSEDAAIPPRSDGPRPGSLPREPEA